MSEEINCLCILYLNHLEAITTWLNILSSILKTSFHLRFKVKLVFIDILQFNISKRERNHLYIPSHSHLEVKSQVTNIWLTNQTMNALPEFPHIKQQKQTFPNSAISARTHLKGGTYEQSRSFLLCHFYHRCRIDWRLLCINISKKQRSKFSYPYQEGEGREGARQPLLLTYHCYHFENQH